MFEVQQKTAYQWEPIPNGEFDTLAAAQAAVAELERELGWTDLRIVEVEND